METYKRLPVAFVQGDGIYLHDANGKRYIDALTGLAVCGLGHAHPRITKAISEQASSVLHTSNLYEIPLQAKLADQLCAVSGMDTVFFGNSGAEANEAAIKIARLHGHKQNIERPAIIVMDGSFHGRTMATLTATGNRKVHAGFEPLLNGFVRAPFDDIEAVRQIAQNNNEIVAVMTEPLLGEGGIVIPDDNYLTALRELCDAQNWLLLLDEVQTGNGRTGKFFAYQHTNIFPDVVTTAKGLANGVPIGACLARGNAATIFQPGNHGSTFGGNPLACAAALAVLETLEDDALVDRAAELGTRMLTGLSESLKGNNRVTEIRGKGLMIAIELSESCTELVSRGLDAGILINVIQDNIVRLLPPLTLTDDEADEIVRLVSQLIND
ncbi:MAG: aspartate aminotransferase family protein [Gammaproteobacteria bacterium]|nr:aspartate aminotransferase family protein [Gammaproteobacteria bacterium]